ncbi:hypothetical protein [Cyanobium sp. ATX 6F1]|uniref:hypothetical protein n=1 Tax=Cyanobium sp. ATX 6F1 TaxID=2823702 RepID=UPI0020CD9BC3|nr:hypothetical protein [Cyanobium sp. ATX 6F1]MCP9916326.1 hypothetical protein [Cyanobium sp. ATX 6F1]
MSIAWIRRMCLLRHLVISLLLIASLDLSPDQLLAGDLSPSDGTGGLDLPPAANEELQESMPELQMFPSQEPAPFLPPLGDSPDAPQI